jgi:hypothetical protein
LYRILRTLEISRTNKYTRQRNRQIIRPNTSIPLTPIHKDTRAIRPQEGIVYPPRRRRERVQSPRVWRHRIRLQRICTGIPNAINQVISREGVTPIRSEIPPIGLETQLQTHGIDLDVNRGIGLNEDGEISEPSSKLSVWHRVVSRYRSCDRSEDRTVSSGIEEAIRAITRNTRPVLCLGERETYLASPSRRIRKAHNPSRLLSEIEDTSEPFAFKLVLPVPGYEE